MAYMRSSEKQPLDYGREDEELLAEEGKAPDDIKTARIMSAVANAIAQRTSAPIETAFYAFTGERLPSHQGPGKVVTPLDLMEQEGQIEGQRSQEELRKAQIEKYLAEAKNKDQAAEEQWFDTGMRSKGADGKDSLAIFMNRRTGETKQAQVPPGTYDRVDIQTAPALMRAWNDTPPPSGGETPEEKRKREAFEAEERRKQQAWEADQKRKGATAPKGKGGGMAPEKPATEAQLSSANFGRRAQDADATVRAMEKAGYDPAAYARAGRNVGVGAIRPFKSSDDRRYEQAQKEFIAAVLRKESGGAITEGEFTEYGAIYFPQPGDDGAVMAQKAAARKAAADNLISIAGPKAAGQVQNRVIPATQEQPPAGAVKLKGRDGYWMKTPDGKAYKRVQ